MASAFERKPIDGNEILRQIAAEKNTQEPGQGTIRDHQTGQVLASAFGTPGTSQSAMIPEPEPSKYQMQTDAYDDMERNNIYAQEMADGGDNSAMMMQRGATQNYVNGEAPMESFTPEELKNAQTDYLNQAGKFSNFAQDNNIDMNELYSRFSEEYTQKDIDMFKDSRKIKTFDDAVKVGMMGDEMADFMNLDTDKFFGEEGTMELCGEECQEKRNSNSQRQIMSMDDEDFEKNFQI